MVSVGCSRASRGPTETLSIRCAGRNRGARAAAQRSAAPDRRGEVSCSARSGGWRLERLMVRVASPARALQPLTRPPGPKPPSHPTLKPLLLSQPPGTMFYYANR